MSQNCWKIYSKQTLLEAWETNGIPVKILIKRWIMSTIFCGLSIKFWINIFKIFQIIHCLDFFWSSLGIACISIMRECTQWQTYVVISMEITALLLVYIYTIHCLGFYFFMFIYIRLLSDVSFKLIKYTYGYLFQCVDSRSPVRLAIHMH